MTIEFTKPAAKQYKKLPREIQRKLDKQLMLLVDNPNHPSLRSRKMTGTERFEARIDYHYRFTYVVDGDMIYIRSVGIHDTGLGKK